MYFEQKGKAAPLAHSQILLLPIPTGATSLPMYFEQKGKAAPLAHWQILLLPMQILLLPIATGATCHQQPTATWLTDIKRKQDLFPAHSLHTNQPNNIYLQHFSYTEQNPDIFIYTIFILI